MPESKKVKEYRQTLQELAKPHGKRHKKVLEGKAAKLGTEIYGEERKAKPKIKPGNKPRK
ncbi:hypothetical protein [Dongia deserti]|uniref:hypothetical protein n=1 Tax=Dongia deserti TaxID=2268030 RepID=UPI000E648EC4|nr:hypothetical protein [Dongia deserti]